jgi:hypothetical protein
LRHCAGAECAHIRAPVEHRRMCTVEHTAVACVSIVSSFASIKLIAVSTDVVCPSVRPLLPRPGGTSRRHLLMATISLALLATEGLTRDKPNRLLSAT